MFAGLWRNDLNASLRAILTGGRCQLAQDGGAIDLLMGAHLPNGRHGDAKEDHYTEIAFIIRTVLSSGKGPLRVGTHLGPDLLLIPHKRLKRLRGYCRSLSYSSGPHEFPQGRP